MGFLFGPTVQASQGFNKLYKASSSRRPLTLFVFQAGESLCMTIYWRKIPLSQDLPPITAGGEWRGGRGGSCWDERVCLCVCSSSGSKAINPVPKCQVACLHASLCHPSLKSDKRAFSALKWWFENGKWWSVIYGKWLSSTAQTGGRQGENELLTGG